MPTPAKKPEQTLPVVALVGRMNVGKSTLFNRLIEEHKALVSDIPGTTRTPNEGVVLWRGKMIRLVDTGGITFLESVPLEKDIITKTERAMSEADVIVFVADAVVGVVRDDRVFARTLQKTKKPVLFVANKVDRSKQEQDLSSREWFSLGLGAPLAVSAGNGRKTGDLLDEIFKTLAKGKRRPKIHAEESADIRVAVIGKPNVGKSSLFNKLIGEEKVIVSPMAHTTREPHDTQVMYEKTPITFIDTAGIRRKANVAGVLERLGVSKSLETILHANIVLLVLDGSVPLSSQDLQLGGLLERHAKSAMILVNKWDLSGDWSDRHRNEVKKMIYSYFPHLDFAPILFVSGLTGYSVHDIFPHMMHAAAARHTEIPAPALEAFLRHATRVHRPARGKGTRHPELLGMRQMGVNPPVFQIYVKHGTSIHSSYVQYLKAKLREQFDFYATPVILKLTKMKR